jgi:hypothetical protein
MLERLSTSQDAGYRGDTAALYSRPMFSTMLTKRRAVDNCRMRSSLCRMS